MTKEIKKLMNKPSDEELKYKTKKLFYGREMEDYITNSIYNDWCRFNFSQGGVKKQIKKDTLYKVWYSYHDASDPMDSSCTYFIYYIEEVPEDIAKSLILWKENEEKVKEYLLN